ncbi:SDR family NAD(P)-dependent oxidoreductase [Emcibacter sp.]|uniref:SDR family NAD(P)-dependent oxidoreductase n=1 Tax=Emcibacter sp. TaxID=1979954 RepID=UPI003A9031D0
MIIWITGAGSGLGRELARQYAADGHRLVVSARTAENLDSLARECRDMPGEIIAQPCDVTDRRAVTDCVRKMVTEAGVPDRVILNAGTHIPSSLDRFDADIHQRLMEVNYMGVVHCLEAILPALQERQHGQIAIVSSLAAWRGLPYAGAYGASKAALVTLAESLRPELARTGIDLRLVCPGFVRTPLTDRNEFHMPLLMETGDAAEAFRRGLEDNRFRIVFPRRMAWVMALLRILPDRLFFRLSSKLLRSDDS